MAIGAGALPDHPGNTFDEAARVFDQRAQHPGAGERQHGGHRQQFRDERQRHLVDLRRSLEDTDDETHGQRGQQQRRRQQQRDFEGMAADGDDGFGGHRKKLCARVPMTSAQPSMSTNNMILNGNEISTGDNIIMPMDMRTLATTRSMITKGMNSRKPIWNAVLSSLVTNAGTRMFSGTSSFFSKPLPPEMRTKVAMSDSRVCASMNDLSGVTAFSIATVASIVPAR